MNMCYNWDKYPPHPPTLFMSVSWGAPPPPLVIAHCFQGLQKGAPQALILYMGAENIFLPYTVPRKPTFLPPPYANAAKLITLSNYKIYIP